MSNQTNQQFLMSRRQRRAMLKSNGILRQISGLNFLGETKTAIRNQNLEQGRKLQSAHLDNIESQQSQELETKLNSLKELWADQGYNQEEISKLEQAWSLGVVKSSENLTEERKEIKRLLKEVKQSKSSRS